MEDGTLRDVQKLSGLDEIEDSKNELGTSAEAGVSENKAENIVEGLSVLVSKSKNDGLLTSSGKDGLDGIVPLKNVSENVGSVSLGSTDVLVGDVNNGLDLRSNGGPLLGSKVLDVSVNQLEDLYGKKTEFNMARFFIKFQQERTFEAGNSASALD